MAPISVAVLSQASEGNGSIAVTTGLAVPSRL